MKKKTFWIACLGVYVACVIATYSLMNPVPRIRYRQALQRIENNTYSRHDHYLIANYQQGRAMVYGLILPSLSIFLVGVACLIKKIPASNEHKLIYGVKKND